MSNAHNPLTMRLYEYIHRTTKRKGESEAGVSHRHENQFICTDDTPGWFLNFHLRAFPSRCSLLFSWQFWQISLRGGLQPKLRAGWSQAKWVIHLCSIMTVFVFFFSTFVHSSSIMSVWYGCIGFGRGNSRIDFTSCPQPVSRAKHCIFLKTSTRAILWGH